jgi:inorganic triphosphatase YgiF
MGRAQAANSTPQGPTETELKLFVPSADQRRLAAHPALNAPRASAPRSEHIVTTYFDTSCLNLAGVGYSLQVRANGERRN